MPPAERSKRAVIGPLATFLALIVLYTAAFNVGSGRLANTEAVEAAVTSTTSTPEPDVHDDTEPDPVTIERTPTRPWGNPASSSTTTTPPPATPTPTTSAVPAPAPTAPPVPPPAQDIIDECWPAGLNMPRPELRFRPGRPGDNRVSGSYLQGVVTLDDDIHTDVARHIACGVVVHELAHHRQALTYGDIGAASLFLGGSEAVERNADCIGQVLGYGPSSGGYGCDNLDDGRRVLAGEMVDRRPPPTPNAVMTVPMTATTRLLSVNLVDDRYGTCVSASTRDGLEVWCAANGPHLVAQRVDDRHGTFDVAVQTSSGIPLIIRVEVAPAAP